MLFFRLAHQKAMQFAGHYRNRHYDGIGSHGEATDGLRLPSPLTDFVSKHFAGQARTLGVKSRDAAVDVVVAGAAGRELELAQPERLVGEQAQQILARGMHGILRYHGESAFVRARPGLGLQPRAGKRGNLKILPQRHFEV